MWHSGLMCRLVALLVLLVACGAPGLTPQAGATLPATATVSSIPLPDTNGTDTGLAVIPYTDPLTVTGLPYPPHCQVFTVAGLPVPDRQCTPGAVGDRVSQANIDVTICTPNWTDSIRPPPKVTEPVKTAAMIAYGIPRSARATTELDHDIPLSLGGADDVANLWPQRSDRPHSGFTNTKDSVERALVKAVCDRRVTLAAARRAIADDWTTARPRLGV